MTPKIVLDELLARKSRPERTRNLTLLNKICEAQAAGARDFSLASIGKLFEAAGGLKARALYNKASVDYQALIEAWRSESPRSAQPPVEPEEKLDDAIAARIADPALRSFFLHITADRQRIRKELDLLKSVSFFTIDRRPKTTGSESTQAAYSPPQAGELNLTPSERRALVAASSPEFLQREGWVAGQNGEILKNGRMVFDIGFLRAIQKVLDATAMNA